MGNWWHFMVRIWALTFGVALTGGWTVCAAQVEGWRQIALLFMATMVIAPVFFAIWYFAAFSQW